MYNCGDCGRKYYPAVDNQVCPFCGYDNSEEFKCEVVNVNSDSLIMNILIFLVAFVIGVIIGFLFKDITNNYSLISIPIIIGILYIIISKIRINKNYKKAEKVDLFCNVMPNADTNVDYVTYVRYHVDGIGYQYHKTSIPYSIYSSIVKKKSVYYRVDDPSVFIEDLSLYGIMFIMIGIIGFIYFFITK